MSKKSLPYKLRKKWDEIISTEGVALGLSGCRSFLENKLVNDIFYEGMFNGRPCIVKCSSKAPDSIANEYEMLKRVHAETPEVFPEPFVLWTSPDGRMAFTAMEKIGGGEPVDPASDILLIAEALRNTGVVHRDISVCNLLCGADGHLKLLDFQFAIDRTNYHESAFMRRNPKYLYVHFGNCESLGLGRWNDVLGLGLAECLKYFAPGDIAAREKLLQMVDEMTFAAPVGRCAKFRIGLYYLSLRIQSLFSHKSSLKWRLYKVRRLRGLKCCDTDFGRETVSFSFCISDNYAQHLSVVIASLLVNNPCTSFVFHVIHRNLKRNKG